MNAQIAAMYRDARGTEETISLDAFVRVGIDHQILGTFSLKQRVIGPVCAVVAVLCSVRR